MTRYRLKAKLKVVRHHYRKQNLEQRETFKKADATPRRRQALIQSTDLNKPSSVFWARECALSNLVDDLSLLSQYARQVRPDESRFGLHIHDWSIDYSLWHQTHWQVAVFV